MIKRKSGTRERSKTKIRKKIFGTAQRPRMTVYRSLNHSYVQLIDDATGTTLLSVSTRTDEVSPKLTDLKGKASKGKVVGKLVAEKAAEKNITSVVFDRNGYRYHGRVRAIAEGAREGGLKF